MRSHRENSLIFDATDDRDLPYVKEVSQLACRYCAGDPSGWQLADVERLWKVFIGGRSGILGIRLDGRVCCVKLYYDGRLRTRLRTMVWLAKSRRAYLHGVRLARAGINCPRMLGWAEHRPTGPTMIVTELIDDGMRLDHWIAKYGVGQGLPAGLARFVRNMHDHGVTHVDLSPRNIMVRARDNGYEFLLLDYEDARFLRSVDRRTRWRDLNHLHERLALCTSLRDRLRFLRVYTPQDYHLYRERLRGMLDRSTSRYLRPQVR